MRLPFARSLGGGYIGRVRMALVTALAIATVALAACGGGDEDQGVQVVPAAGEFAQTDNTTAGVPVGASYDLTGARWNALPDEERLASVEDYVADNPDTCAGAAPRAVLDYADASVGADYPLTAPVAELLAEGCAAALQSGDRSGAKTT